MEMTPRERVLAALRREEPDRVPFLENDIEEELQVSIMGRSGFTPPELCAKIGLDGFGFHYPGERAGAGQALQSTAKFGQDYYYPEKITFDFVPPWIAEMGVDPDTGRTYVAKGLLTSPESLALFDRYLPDPDHPARYERVAQWIKKYRGDYAVFARIRLGTASMLESMGLDVFSYASVDNPDLISAIHRRFSAWSARVVDHLNGMDIDFLWVNDDLAWNNGPFMSPLTFRELILPHMRTVAERIRKPWIFHSDGNIFPLLPDLLTLNMSAIHPIQPAAMDIVRMKREYGDRVCIVGNIDLDYTLSLGSPAETEAEVRERIRTVGAGGGYIVSSANSLTDYCRLENVLAMAGAIKKYGQYPLEV
ncbi:MAG: hypothetical protein M0Z41_12050 [Peptococcaceae bacterium]|jgi:uroporphyrinogen-III decarboxylase|nr:hypothetical protein [Peptococcaceae bacterium]